MTGLVKEIADKCVAELGLDLKECQTISNKIEYSDDRIRTLFLYHDGFLVFDEDKFPNQEEYKKYIVRQCTYYHYYRISKTDVADEHKHEIVDSFVPVHETKFTICKGSYVGKIVLENITKILG